MGKTVNFLSLDLIGIRDRLNNLLEIYNFLDNMIDELGLKKIFRPVLIPYYHGKVETDCGVSCYSLFDGGYCTFHIFERRKIAYFDIVSEKAIDKQKVIDFTTKYCKTKKVLVNSNESQTAKNQNIFGPHYICQGKVEEGFNELDMLTLHEKIISKIGMTPITTPAILRTKKSVTLFIAIAESHIALVLQKRELRVDIFSCKMFDVAKLKNLLKSVMKNEYEMLYHRLYKIDK